MHRRNSTNRRRLDRRKSTTSVKSVQLEHILPETAERDAQVAATQAFMRARERSSPGSTTPLWPPSRCGGSRGTALSCSPHVKAWSEEAPLCRTQSIRFVQSRPAQLTPNSSMAQKPSPSYPPRTSSRLVGQGKVDPRPDSRASASGMVSAIKGAAGDYISTLFTSDECYTPEDDIASMPSSYRKLRKSRSMFTNKVTATMPEHFDISRSSASANQLPLSASFYPRPPRGNENVRPRIMKTPKSMTFLRDFRDNFVPPFKSDGEAASTIKRGGNPEITKDQPRPRSKPSGLFRSRAPNEDRAFRKSMRNISNNTNSTDSEPAKGGSLRCKARRVSQGFKHRLKNLFSLGKVDSEGAKLPIQHIDAQKSHNFGLGDLESDVDDELCLVSSNDQAALSHVASGIPSLHAVPSCQQLRSRQGSMESLRSELKASDERSRVTSWSNSDTNTVVTHSSFRNERERKRLSIINENGAHICSSSTGFIGASEESNSSTASLYQPTQAAPMTVDGQRIYSALMKRMRHLEQAQASHQERQQISEDLMRTGTGHQYKNSTHSQSLGSNRTSTIRYVMSESGSESGSPTTNKGSHSKVGEILQSVDGAKGDMPNHLASAHLDSDTTDVPQKGFENGTLTAPPAGAAPPLLRTLSSRSSAFFGSPTRHLFRTKSPFRRALQERMHTASDEPSIGSPDFNPWMRSLSNLPNFSMQRSNTYGSDADIKLGYAESIYSTNTEDDQTKRYSVLSIAENCARPISTHGDATIFVDTPAYNKRGSSLPPKQRISSSSSSLEWKMWLSSNVSKLEETTAQVDPNSLKYDFASPHSSGHVRESAQINDEREDQVCNPLDTTYPVPRITSGLSNLDGVSQRDDQPTPFDAEKKDTTFGGSQISFTDPLSPSIPASSIASAAVHAKDRAISVDRDKELPQAPPLSLKGRSNRCADIATKLVKRHAKPNNSMTPLTNRSVSSVGEDQPKLANSLPTSRRKMYGRIAEKAENVSPALMNDDDPYGIEGAGVLGPNQQSVESKRMVDIFLSSRRRRMASEDEGSVFL
ncbi:hypothetical protein F4777DRAFT_593602 [Nemania sp. FL0916]|nr:hypothetical protein F4777DRAFT_593602 [Nemania sp. FL0916]